MNTNLGKELYNIMDALVALRIDLKCDPCVPGEVLVLSAEKARAACEALDSASASLRKLVTDFDDCDLSGLSRH